MRRSVGKILPALFWALAALPAAAADASAQAQADLVDRVVAIVGDTAILQSEIQEALFRLQAQQGTRLPNDRQQMRDLARQVLHQQINEALVVIHARRDGLTVSDAEVNDEVEDRIATIKRQFPSEMAFQQALVAAGFTPAEFRLQMIEQTRAELLTQRYLGQRVSELKPVPISE